MVKAFRMGGQKKYQGRKSLRQKKVLGQKRSRGRKVQGCKCLAAESVLRQKESLSYNLHKEYVLASKLKSAAIIQEQRFWQGYDMLTEILEGGTKMLRMGM